jgi:hypothetical protein
MKKTWPLLLAWALSGCVHLYDSKADKLAAEAKTGYDESKVTEALKGEYSKLEALEKREVEAFVKLVAAQRDLMLLSLLSDSADPFLDRFHREIGHRLSELASTPGTALDLAKVRQDYARIQNARKVIDNRRRADKAQREQLIRLDPALARLVACEEKNARLFNDATAASLGLAIEQPNHKPTSPVLQQYAQYVDKVCKPILAGHADERKAMETLGGQVTRAATEARQAMEAFAKGEASAKAARAELKKATEAEAAARKTRDEAVAKPLVCKEQGDAKEQPNAVCVALKNLRDLGNVGIKALSEEQIDGLELAIAALSGDETAAKDPQLPPALALLGTVSRFGSALARYRASGTLPALEPLLIEKQLRTAELALANRSYDLSRARVALANERLNALLLEVNLLLNANAQLGGITRIKCPSKPNLKTDFYCASATEFATDKDVRAAKGAKGEPAARSVYRALAFFAESYSVARTRFETADLKLILADHRDALSNAEFGLVSWDAIVARPVAQLQAYHASGIKSAEIAQLLQALGLFGIAGAVQ